MIVPGPPGQPGRTWGYWGSFAGWRPGSYRATCAWLADPTWGTTHGRRDNRVLCTVLLSFCSGPVASASRTAAASCCTDS